MKRAGQFMVPDSDTYFAPFLEQGGFQLDHLQQALGFVTDFRVAVDGGAHVGSWALKMAEVFDEVIAFEPAEDTFECLNENVWKSTNVSPFCAALGAEFGRGKIVDDISSEREGRTWLRAARRSAERVRLHGLTPYRSGSGGQGAGSVAAIERASPPVGRQRSAGG